MGNFGKDFGQGLDPNEAWEQAQERRHEGGYEMGWAGCFDKFDGRGYGEAAPGEKD